MKTPKEILFPDVDEIENNDWDSLREFLEDTLKAIQDDLHRNVYEDLKILVEPWIDYSAISTIVGWASFTT
ncbi:MAG TPA: hypothetical protein ENN27_02120, partial [Candidatus Atribacteria bacterium]|nr:hypothetical protein [Candidatus Atribacteria bacterium]